MLVKYVRPIATRALAVKPCSHHACFSVSTSQQKKMNMKTKPVLIDSHTGKPVSNQDFLSKNSFPPSTFLRSAFLSGTMKLTTDEALIVLEKYITLAKSLKADWEQDFLREANVDARLLTLLGLITTRSPGHGQSRLGHHILKTASKLGDFHATNTLLVRALGPNGSLDDPSLIEPFQHLKRAAELGENAEAMNLYGMAFERKGQIESAFQWYVKAGNANYSTPETTRNMLGVSDALVSLGKFWCQRKEFDKARIAFKKAAIELDNPTAYYYLGLLMKSASTQQEIYLMKAAASGFLEATVHLGKMYVQRAVKDGKPDFLLNASEWFELAATSGSHGDKLADVVKFCRDQATAATPSWPIFLDILKHKLPEDQLLKGLAFESDTQATKGP